MKLSPVVSTPAQASYDVVIVGGAIIGSSVAWFLSDNPDFDGSILVVEKDPTYEHSRRPHQQLYAQQFSNELNIQISSSRRVRADFRPYARRS